MASYVMVSPEEAELLGLTGTLVDEAELAAAIAAAPEDHREAQEAAAADAALFEDGPQDAQEGASEPPDVEVEAGVAKRPRRARRPAGGGDGGQFAPDDPATPENEAYEPVGT
jgi:hypothetical protein